MTAGSSFRGERWPYRAEGILARNQWRRRPASSSKTQVTARPLDFPYDPAEV
jgi:hypothetical protein